MKPRSSYSIGAARGITGKDFHSTDDLCHRCVVGPRFYIAPELEDGRSLDVTPTADICSLGKILYFMLSGGRIFSQEKHNVPAWDLEVIHRDPRYGL